MIKKSVPTQTEKLIDNVLDIMYSELTWETDVPHIDRMIRRIKALKKSKKYNK